MSDCLDGWESGRMGDWLLLSVDHCTFPKLQNIIFDEEEDMAKYEKNERECCYEEMSKAVGGQSQPSEYHEEPMRNSYEDTRKSYYGDKGIDWSGMEKSRG